MSGSFSALLQAARLWEKTSSKGPRRRARPNARRLRNASPAPRQAPRGGAIDDDPVPF
jgi:hypothetical protein